MPARRDLSHLLCRGNSESSCIHLRPGFHSSKSTSDAGNFYVLRSLIAPRGIFQSTWARFPSFSPNFELGPSCGMSKPRERQAYASNFRSSLTALVILHHTAISYGGDGVGVYQSSFHPPASSMALVGFNALNQSFFMGSFFYLSGYFTRKALQRKSRSTFTKDRLYRLGLPTLAYTLVGPPLCTAIMTRKINPSIFLEHWKSNRGVRGPVWFTGVLLILDLVYALIYPRLRVGGACGKIGTKNLLSAVTLCAAADFVWRTQYPVGYIFRPLNLNLGYLPQYLATYLYGTCVNSLDCGNPSPNASLFLLLQCICSGFVLAKAPSFRDFKGGWNALAASYALWNNSTGYLVGSALLKLFLAFGNTPCAVATSAYPAFLVHMPVSVLIETLTDQWRASAVTKAFTIGISNVVASWGVVYLAEKAWKWNSI